MKRHNTFVAVVTAMNDVGSGMPSFLFDSALQRSGCLKRAASIGPGCLMLRVEQQRVHYYCCNALPVRGSGSDGGRSMVAHSFHVTAEYLIG
eukprot:CAMPEP_0169332372 /NCGR_PEP_ID=MMETSP1017-20121227/14685_1 /TAXON_ID=342587 /ORGANISM="Karlodinium micrum, Strain CCMP2283" /LENGTH=91 /DNA_ID=CAMNT_0009427511 /DNA_START=149 /DNA_END=422 /DNA_ORIENTATION=-